MYSMFNKFSETSSSFTKGAPWASGNDALAPKLCLAPG